jgi:hypothetical protein
MLFKLLSMSLVTAALPFGNKVDGSNRPREYFDACPVSNATITFPAGQTALSIPPGQVPNHILFGKGVQNYTCSDSGTYVYVPCLDALQTSR